MQCPGTTPNFTSKNRRFAFLTAPKLYFLISNYVLADARPIRFYTPRNTRVPLANDVAWKVLSLPDVLQIAASSL